ncbi:hypothetical protein RO1_36550 [Roseburia intestinalis XB6B4]|uniref:Uncharacterized protein n=1 Tax=Roseburia intestinalis XB6B4 TaxID=718255 RepID=D4L2R5_9FIRM|nr:hypothetical protein RO1_36550 [Roseburia intestinalis XB6B4]
MFDRNPEMERNLCFRIFLFSERYVKVYQTGIY